MFRKLKENTIPTADYVTAKQKLLTDVTEHWTTRQEHFSLLSCFNSQMSVIRPFFVHL